MALIEGGAYTATTVELFETNSHLRAVIAECSGNVFVMEALKRMHKIRRLIEYGRNVVRADNVASCREHLLILDLILQDRRAEAADALRLHLSLVSMKKGRVPVERGIGSDLVRTGTVARASRRR